ncbi:hypothetical protein AVEN_211049-1 [Araneus ventricosus]|uniref:Uncharacterized protein n=1 Tax=Araneus ventricosus TaxID=182803 RepID=A0A4Y2T086_ARAVE|nr:hypothetical protein AVEN_211049-1 [Araneus ventricosus]
MSRDAPRLRKSYNHERLDALDVPSRRIGERGGVLLAAPFSEMGSVSARSPFLLPDTERVPRRFPSPKMAQQIESRHVCRSECAKINLRI